MFHKSLVLLVVGTLFTELTTPALAISAPDARGRQVRVALMNLETEPSGVSSILVGLAVQVSAQPTSDSQQASEAEWRAVQSLRTGSKVRIATRSGSRLEGQLVEVRDDAVVLANVKVTKGDPPSSDTGWRTRLTLTRANVATIAAKRMSVGNKVAMWSAIGGAAFVGMFAAAWAAAN